MPLYNLACDACETVYEDVVASVADRNSIPCDTCGKHLRVHIEPVETIGANFSKPIKVGKKVYETNAEFRRANAAAEAKGFGLVSKSDTEWKNMNDEMGQRREKTAQAQGFRNESHRQASWKRRRLQGR